MCDTNDGVILLTERRRERKVEKLIHGLSGLIESERYSRREAAEVRGKLVNYGQCMEETRPFCVPLTLVIGSPTSDYEWDERLHVPDYLCDNARHLHEVIPQLAREGSLIWRKEPATVQDR